MDTSRKDRCLRTGTDHCDIVHRDVAVTLWEFADPAVDCPHIYAGRICRLLLGCDDAACVRIIDEEEFWRASQENG